MADRTEPGTLEGSRHDGATVTDHSKAAFLSYASQDAEAAQRLCNALRGAGIEVWFDQHELRGGDVWDQKIRREIHDCALFIPVISANTASRQEGYFRFEWDLADQRTHMLARNRAFIVPVCLDATPDAGADVPESFQRVQWTRLPGGETPPEFVRRIEQLLRGEVRPTPTAARGLAGAASGRSSRGVGIAVAVVIAAAIAYLLIERPWGARPPPPAAFAPPPHSIAVLPFVNMSGDKEQEYFSDGLTEELLNSLAQINELHVAARASSFSFRGQFDVVTVGHKLNVATVLEGSVRRSEHKVRITVQLIDALTGFHAWSKTYDRDLGDVLTLQTEIATAVAEALKVTLLGDTRLKIEAGGTRNPAAFDAYLRASKAYYSRRDDEEIPNAIAGYTEAIRLDPNYALAYAGRSVTYTGYAGSGVGGNIETISERFANAQLDARHALALAPELAQAHLALANASEQTLDFGHARAEYERAVALAPGAADVLRLSGEFSGWMGHFDQGLVRLRQAVALNPLDHYIYFQYGRVLYFARRYDEALSAYAAALRLEPDFKASYAYRGLALYMLSELQAARSSCEARQYEEPEHQMCLALVYNKLGRHADAEARLAKLKAAFGDSGAYEYSAIYAQWGDKPKALRWLDRAVQLADTNLEELKTDPLMDPLRKEPRFQAIEQELMFPD
jgi:TolB-like protein/Tfp pilus assembly protein PilF